MWQNNWKVCKVGGSFFACGDAGQIAYSNDGKTWATVNPLGGALFGIHGAFGIIIAAGQGVARSLDAINFVAVTVPKYQGAYDYIGHSVSIADSTTIYIGCDRGMILKSTDGGQHFFESPVSPAFIGYGMWWLNNFHGFAACPGGILETGDGGQTWVKRLDSGAMAMRDVFVGADGHGFACGDAGLLYRTADGGQSWQKIDLGLTANFLDMSCLDGLNAWVCGADLAQGTQYILKTTDGGASWTNVSVGYSAWTGIHVVDANTAVVVGLKQTGVTTDGGSTWTSANGASTYSSLMNVFLPTITATPAPTPTTVGHGGKKNG